MHLYELKCQNLQDVYDICKEIPYSWHRLQTMFGLAKAEYSAGILTIEFNSMRLTQYEQREEDDPTVIPKFRTIRYLEFIDKNLPVEVIGEVLLKFDNGDIPLDEITYLVASQEFKMQPEDLHWAKIQNWLRNTYQVEVDPLRPDPELRKIGPKSKYRYPDLKINMAKNPADKIIQVEVSRFMRRSVLLDS